MKPFSDDMIRRTDLPTDAFRLIHDLCYDHAGRDRSNYAKRSRAILRRKNPTALAESHGKVRARGYKCRGCDARVAYEGDYCGECICEDDGV